ncbi:MAG: insulinase family protein [bacterium]|nr:insulinase family protein [bacterium]
MTDRAPRLVSCVAALLALGAAHASDVAALHSTTLDNGLRVSVLVDERSAVVATQLWYHVGSAHEGPGTRGLAHLFEHLMFGDTSDYAGRELEELHHRHGGSNNAYTTPDETVYVSVLPPGPHLQLIRREAQRMRGLIQDDENLDNEKRIVTEELRMRTENDPLMRALVAAQSSLLGEHPYAYDAAGSKEDVAAATLDGCRTFYDRYYRPSNAHLVVVGPVDPEETLRVAREAFGDIADGGETAREVPALLDWSFPPETVVREDLPPVETALAGFVLPPPSHADHWALTVMQQLLHGGEVDVFEREIVGRRGKAVVAGTQTLQFRSGGAVAFFSASLPYRRKKTAFRHIGRVLDELARLEWLTDERLAAAKKSLLLREYDAAYFVERRADAIGRAEWWQGSAELALDRVARLQEVSRDDVERVFARYLRESEPIRLYLRPQRVPWYIHAFGWLYPLVSR